MKLLEHKSYNSTINITLDLYLDQNLDHAVRSWGTLVSNRPSRDNSTPRKNPAMCNPPVYIVNHRPLLETGSTVLLLLLLLVLCMSRPWILKRLETCCNF